MPSQQPATTYQSWIDAVNSRQWTNATGLLCPSVNCNGNDHPRDDYISNLKDDLSAMPNESSVFDTLIVDHNSSKLAVRLIHTATLCKPFKGAQVTGTPIQWSEHVFCWLGDGKISKFVSIVDVDAMRQGNTHVAVTPRHEQEKTPDGMDNTQFYHAYIDIINNLTMKSDLHKFCQPDVTHNMHQLTTEEYRLMIESSFDDIRGLHFSVEELVVDDDSAQIAARLGFTGLPVRSFRGIEPTGKEVRFSEHAYYKLHQGRIFWVTSLLDLEAYRTCMAN